MGHPWRRNLGNSTVNTRSSRSFPATPGPTDSVVKPSALARPGSAGREARRRADEMIRFPHPGVALSTKRLIHAIGEIVQDDGETNHQL